MKTSIDVTYNLATTAWKTQKVLKELAEYPLLSFDTETRGMYTKEERKAAEKALEDPKIRFKQRREYSLIASSSGLSFPSLVNVTHFIFGTSKEHSVVVVTDTPTEEMRVWNWVKDYKGHLLIHNASFDLKIMFNRVKAFPKNYTDTMLLAKCYINNANNFESKVGLKHLMGSYYKPAWSLLDDYEPKDLTDPEFLDYCATDGASVQLLWEELEELKNNDT